MITFKQFLTEGFYTDLGDKMAQMRKDIAADLGVRGYRVIINRGPTPENGIRINIAVPIPDDHTDAENFFQKMVQLSVKKTLNKHFTKHHIDSIDGTSWDAGRAIWVNMIVPDGEGLM